jgi:hypothetical protein
MADIDEIVSMAAPVHFARREPADPDNELDTEQVSAHWHSSDPLVLTDCAENLFPAEHAAMFSLVYDDGGGDASPLATTVCRVEVTPPQTVFTGLEFETFYKLSKFLIHDKSHHKALVKIFDIRSELVDMVQRGDGTNACMVRVALQATHPKSSSAVTHSGSLMIPLLSLSEWFTFAVTHASLATPIHPERHPALALDPTSLSLRRQKHR